jgi:hypothetical protein
LFKKARSPIVLVSFGSVVDVGIFEESDLTTAKQQLEEAEGKLKKEKSSETETEVKMQKERVQQMEDSLGKERALLTVFHKFQAKPQRKQKGGKPMEEYPHAEFIWKYGEKPAAAEEGQRKRKAGWGIWEKTYLRQENVYAKAWLPQKQILGEGMGIQTFGDNIW